MERRRLRYSDVMSTLAVFLALTGGSIAIASVGADDVGTREVEDESLKSRDLADDKAVKSQDVVNGTLEGIDINEDELDVGAAGLDPLPHGMATAGGPQTFPDGIVTKVAFDNANPSSDLVFDATNETLTVSTDGVYLLNGELQWAPNTTGRRVVQIVVDGSVVAEDSREALVSRTSQSTTTLERLGPGDVLTLQGQQTSGGDLDTEANGSHFGALSAAYVSSP